MFLKLNIMYKLVNCVCLSIDEIVFFFLSDNFFIYEIDNFIICEYYSCLYRKI